MVVPGHMVEEPGARRDTAVQLKRRADLATERKSKTGRESYRRKRERYRRKRER